MGKNLASDSHNAANCVAEGGADAVYKITLPERSLINAEILAPFDAKIVVRKVIVAVVKWCTAPMVILAPIPLMQVIIMCGSTLHLRTRRVTLTWSFHERQRSYRPMTRAIRQQTLEFAASRV